ncbi:unnamed protein product [Diamesa serratosioi]
MKCRNFAILCLVMALSAISIMAGPSYYYRGNKALGCPTKFDHRQTVHLPHPLHCNKYLTCLSKSVLEQTCPDDLHWNAREDMCDYHHNSNCRTDVVYYNRITRQLKVD